VTTKPRARPEPAGEPAPTTIDPAPTPIEEVPGNLPEVGPPVAGPNMPCTVVPVFGARMAGRATLDAVAEQRLLPDLAVRMGTDSREDYPLTAAEALAEVFRRVQPIAKGRQAEPKAGGYAFRGIDDVYAALHDLFAEVGLVCLPSTLDREREQRPRTSGTGYNYVTHIHVRLRFLAADGSSEELDGWGEGADTGDKSTGKAYSQAIKSALLAAFLIPTEASSVDDPDRTNSEESRPFSAEEVERAIRASTAATSTTTVEELAGVRHRALALLDVPVPLDGGRTAPLGYLIDEQRRRIETGGATS
jgi:hypothetical protein